jgi:hypothetical protein
MDVCFAVARIQSCWQYIDLHPPQEPAAMNSLLSMMKGLVRIILIQAPLDAV